MADDKALRIAERDGLCSLSSNTKWQRLIPVFGGFPVQKRIKFIDVEEPTRWQTGLWQPHPNYIEASGGPEELKFVEWIEIEMCERRYTGRLVAPVTCDYSEAIRSALVAERASFKESETSFVVFGYSRPTQID